MAKRQNVFSIENARRLAATVACCLALIGATHTASAQTSDPTSCDPIPASPGASCMDDVTTCSLNCNANDVRLAIYNVVGTCNGGSQDGLPCVVGSSTACEAGGGTCVSNAISCIDGEELTVMLQAELIANSAERWDVGIYVALDGGDALNGDCLRAHLNDTPLEPGSTGDCTPSCSTSGGACFKDADCPVGETCDFGYDPNSGDGPYFDGECTEDPADSCGDLEQGVNTYLTLAPITLLCQDADGNGYLDLGTCTSWDNAKSAGTTNKPSCMSADDTLPNTPSKCRCEPVQVGTVVFIRKADIEVCKDLVPNGDAGVFDLDVDGVVKRADAGDGECTGKVRVSAGTTSSPGDTHTVGESAGTGTNLSDYTSTISCVDRGLATFNGGAPLTFSGTGPLNVPVDPDDDIVCTVTNTHKCDGVDCSYLNNACNVGVCSVVGGTAVCQAQTINEGGACDDGDLCTVGDVCTGGACGGSPKDCSGASDQCNVGVCNATTGACEAQPTNEGGACDDGDPCTVSDVCTGGTCGGSTKDCSGASDQCNVGVCNAVTGACEAQPTNEGSGCDDGLYCTVGETCTGGVCDGGSSRVCDDAIACTSDACDEILNQCVFTPNANLCDDFNACTDNACVLGVGCVYTPDDSNSCSDGLYCNGQEACVGGTCQSGIDPCDDGVVCTTDTCNESTDSCVNSPVNAACDDGLYCNGVETCDAINGCLAGTPVNCSGLDDQCNIGVCNDTSDACEAQPANEGLACVDGLYCNVGEVCIGGVCGGGGPRDCDDSVACTVDACNENTDQCVHTPDDVFCDDGLYCTGTEVCDPINDCQPGTGDPCLPPTKCEENLDTCVICSSDAQCDDGSFCNGVETCVANACVAGTPPCGDDGVSCTVDSCDDVNDVCVHQPDDGLCDNGQWCDGVETCDAVFDCQAGTAVECGDGVGCTVDSCNELTDSCDNVPNDSLCNNGLYCDGEETCDAVFDCLSGTPIDCSHLDNQCNIGVCDDALDACVREAANEGSACDDGLYCTVGEVCVSGTCNNSVARDCDDAVNCTTDSCDETNDVCVHTPQDTLCDDAVGCTTDVCNVLLGCVLTPVDAACDDGVVCTDDTCDAINDCVFTPNDGLCDDGDPCTIDSCDAAGGCMHDAVDCSGLDDQCLAGVCNPISGFCEAVPSNEAGACDDGEACTVLDICDNGTCVGVPKDCSGLDDQCNIGVCNATTGACEAQPTNEGGSCDDGDACTVSDTCTGGACGGSPKDCTGLNDQCNVGVCNATTGACEAQPTNEGGSCDDGIACTTNDTCTGGSCGGTPVVCADDGDFCNGTEACNPANGTCVSSGNPCGGATAVCCESNDSCVAQCCDASTCNDGNPCTTDTCNAGTCNHNPVICADDGNYCNGVELCDPARGACVSSGSPCPIGVACCEGDDSCRPEGCPRIPTVSEWGMLILTLLLLTIGKVCFGRRQEDLSTGGL